MMTRTILAEYFSFENFILLCMVREDFLQPHIVEIPCSLRNLQVFIQANFRVTPEEARLGLTSAHKISDISIPEFQNLMEPLVKPLFGRSPLGDVVVERGDIIWFVAHDVLHYVPLHAVKIEGQYLIDRNAICYTPSASVMKYCAAKRKGQYHNIVIFADSQFDDSELRLVHAREQVHDLKELFGDKATVYIGPNATKSNLYGHVGTHDVDILHFACHGSFRLQDPLQSSIMLAHDQTTKDFQSLNLEEQFHNKPSSWELTAKEVFNMRLNVDLVTLSACESGVSQHRSGDELLGLIRAFIYAGTSSLLVSLWSVDEIATSLLMKFFYGALLGGNNKAESLQIAQKTLKMITIEQALVFADMFQSHIEIQTDIWNKQALRKSIADLHYKAANYKIAVDEYNHLATSPDISPSLRAQIRNSIRACTSRLLRHDPIDYSITVYSHPFYWAGFVLIGDWQ